MIFFFRLAWLLSLFLSLTSAWADPPIEAGVSEMRRLVDSVDELIGGTRADDNRSYSTLRLSSNWENRRSQTPEPPHLHAKFALKLGKLKDWQNDIQSWADRRIDILSAKVRAEEQALFGGPARSSREEERSSNAGPAGPPEKDPWRFTLEPHVVWSAHPAFRVGARLRKDFEYSRVIHSFSPEVAWSTKQRWDTTGTLTSSSRLAEHWMVSFSNSVNWGWSEKVFVTAHGPSMAYLLGTRQVFTLGCGTTTSVEDHVWFARSYAINSGYRLAAWHERFFTSVNPFIEYQKSRRFESDPGISVSIEIVL